MAITFKRPLSTLIQDYFATKAALNSRSYNAQIAVEIVLQDETILSYATKQITVDSLSSNGASVDIDPISFTARLTGTPDIRHSQTKTVDAGDFEVANLDYILSAAIPNSARPFDNTFVTAYLCFPKASGNYEGLIYFVGLLREIQGDDDSARLSVISDLSDKTALLGIEITQRCLNDLGDAWCAVTHLPFGAVCTKIWHDAIGGCKYWGGVFQGAPFLDPNAYAPGGYIGGDPGSGWEPPACPDLETTWFESANGGAIAATDKKLVGQIILNHRGEPVTIEAAEPIFQPYRYKVETAVGASLINSATHRFLIGVDDDKGKAACNWKFEHYSMVATTPAGLIVIAPTRPRENGYKFLPYPGGMCLKITTSAPHTYNAGMQPGYYLANHNIKWDPIFLPN